MKYLLCLFVTWVMFTSGAIALPIQDDDEKEKSQPTEEVQEAEEGVTPKSRLKDVKSDLMDGIRSLANDYYAAETDEEKSAVVAKRRKMEEDSVKQAIEIYRESGDEKVNVQSMRDLARQTKGAGRRMLLETAIELHADSDEIKRLLTAVGQREPAPEVDDFYSALQDKSSSNEVKAWVDYYQANHGAQLRELDEARKSSLVQSYGDTFTRYANAWTGDDGEEKILKLLKRCEERFADVETDNQMLKRMVAGARASLNLAIGKVAPDIIGKDLDGVEFKLSDYRGKVVMLDFWGDW